VDEERELLDVERIDECLESSAEAVEAVLVAPGVADLGEAGAGEVGREDAVRVAELAEKRAEAEG
jgi:hypothetical protein